MDVPAYGEAEAAFHFLLDGECTLEAGDQSYPLKAGDAVLLPSSPPHRIRTAGAGGLPPGVAETQGVAETRGVVETWGVVETQGDFFDTIRSDSAGEGVIDLFCGHYTFGSRAGVLLSRSLPDPLVVSFGESSELVRTMSGLLRQEALAEGPGTSAVLSSLCTALLAMVLRQSTDRRAETPVWTAVDDKRIAAVIDAVLRDPGADWSIERLAGIATLARATFLRRFVKNTGTTVGAFLTNVRMMTAADLLADRELTVAAVASKVGYHSESAFARVFQEAVGTTPGRFRRTL
jgi:AraC family transcriptional regulator, activator of mtrCDE